MLGFSEFKEAGIFEVDVMQESFVYPFLHQKHAELAPKFAEVLKQMKEEGLLDTYLPQSFLQ